MRSRATVTRRWRGRRAARRTLLTLLLFGGTVVCARAAPLADYRARVRECAVALDALTSQDEEATAEEIWETEERTLSEVRRRLPPREAVEWPGGRVEADNSWLHEALDAHQARDDWTADEHAADIARLAQQLSALDKRLAEAEESLKAGAPLRDKATEKGRLAEILRRPEFRRDEANQESALRRLWEQIAAWLRDLFPRQEPIRPGQTPRLTRAAQIVVYAIAGLVVAFVLWRFGPRLWRRASLRVTPERGPRVVLGEVLSEEETPADLLAEAERLARAGDLRGAIRKAYVALLADLGDRRVIRLARHLTNRDYLEAVRRERAALFPLVQPLTENFERHWYGAEDATQDDWANFRARCRQALQS